MEALSRSPSMPVRRLRVGIAILNLRTGMLGEQDWNTLCEVYSYPEPFLRTVRRTISELASDWLVLTPDIVFLPCFYGIRLWIWPEPLIAPRVRRALGTRMCVARVTNLVPMALCARSTLSLVPRPLSTLISRWRHRNQKRTQRTWD
jgi:hypothetical protein